MASKRKASPKPTADSTEFLSGLMGRWSGTVKTWMEPGAPPLTASVTGHFYKVLKASSIGHTYSTKVSGRTAQGMVIVGRDLATSRYCMSWVDTFHTQGDMMLFHRDEVSVPRGFSVRGEWAVAPGEPRWGWRITYQLKSPDSLEIVHYIIKPDGEEKPAIKVAYKRATSARPSETRAASPRTPPKPSRRT